MRYQPTREGNKWVTKICSANMGIHDQSQFKSGVAMLETAIDEWTSPRLMHLILTGCETREPYALFIDRVKRHMPTKAYKVGIELDERKGTHAHWMLIIDADSPESLFDLDDDSSAIYKARSWVQRTHPDFEVTIAQPRRHKGTPYIPLSEYTLQDAAEWLSYAIKVRSKPAGPCYWSSRLVRRRCTASAMSDDRELAAG
jgi:hypothetical protein